MDYRILLCKCGVEAPHARVFNDKNKLYGLVCFSKQALLHQEVEKIFPTIVHLHLHKFVCGFPTTTEDMFDMFIRILPEIDFINRRHFELIKELIENADSRLPDNNIEAWNNLPHLQKEHIIKFVQKGMQGTKPETWPGAYNTEWELLSTFGANPPDNPNAKCNIMTRLFFLLPEKKRFQEMAKHTLT